MYIIHIALVGDKYPTHFGVVVDEDTYSLYARYIRENYPNVGYNDTNMPSVIRNAINSGVNGYFDNYPQFKGREVRFGDINSLHQISILNDSIVSKTVRSGNFVIENHEGLVSYSDRDFAFSYKSYYYSSDKIYITPLLAITYDAYILPQKEYHGQSTSLASACHKAIEWENKAKEDELYKADFKVWEDYYRANKEAFNRWFFPLLESRCACKKCQNFIKWSVLTKRSIMSLEKGICPFCASNCRLANNGLKDGEHAEEWYELKLDDHYCPN